jgi:hypothetical protein
MVECSLVTRMEGSPGPVPRVCRSKAPSPEVDWGVGGARPETEYHEVGHSGWFASVGRTRQPPAPEGRARDGTGPGTAGRGAGVTGDPDRGPGGDRRTVRRG